MFIEQTTLIKEHRQGQQIAWNIDVKTCKLSERADLNHKNFKIYFHHASQYQQVLNAYHALLNDYLQVRLNLVSKNLYLVILNE